MRLSDIPHTRAGRHVLYHPDVEALGPDVAVNVIRLVEEYARRVSISDIPPITFTGPGWDRPWDQIRDLSPCSGNAGSSCEEFRRGEDYRGLALTLPIRALRADEDPHRQDLEGTIAHAVRTCEMRRTRYIGSKKLRLQAFLTATAMNERPSGL